MVLQDHRSSADQELMHKLQNLERQTTRMSVHLSSKADQLLSAETEASKRAADS